MLVLASVGVGGTAADGGAEVANVGSLVGHCEGMDVGDNKFERRVSMKKKKLTCQYRNTPPCSLRHLNSK